MKKNRAQSGQVVLITLLVLTIATTVALSLIARTTTDTTITAQVEESSRAFSAAEAGIEQSLKSGIGANGIVVAANVSYNVTVNSIGGAVGGYEFSKKTLKGDTETLWLVAHDSNGVPIVTTPTYTASSVDICWSSETVTPVLLATLLYKESSNSTYQVAKALLSTPAEVPNGCGPTGTAYKQTIGFKFLNSLAFPLSIAPESDILIALRIRPLYSDTKIAINAEGTLPQQGNHIESTGSTTTGTNRKIVVVQQYRSADTVFDAALYSQGDVSQ